MGEHEIETPEVDESISVDDLAAMFEAEEAGATQAPAEEPIEVVEENAPVEEPVAVEADDEPLALEETIVVEDQEPVSEGTVDEISNWAERRGISTLEDALKLAYNQDKILGRKASEAKENLDIAVQWQEYSEQQDAVIHQLRAQLEAGGPEAWVESAATSPDPRTFVLQAYVAGDHQRAYELLQTWAESNPASAREVAMEIAAYEEQAYAPQPVTADDIRQDLMSVGIFDPNDAVAVEMRRVIGEFGPDNRYVAATRSPDPQVRQMALSALADLARTRMAKVRTVRADVSEEQRQQQEQARLAAAGVAGTGENPRLTNQPRVSKFDQEMEEEWRRQGWI